MKNIYFPLDKVYKTLEGKALVGKVEFVDPTTTTLLDTYAFNKDGEYVAYKNPCFTGVFGELPTDVFVKDTQTLVKLYSYVGDLSNMEIDQDPNHWVFLYSYFKGFNNDSEVVDNDKIATISDLRNTDTSKGVVWVNGYFNDHDCQPRMYWWDEDATDAEDGGYVIKSNVDNDGRWILLWDGESLPATFYGVTSDNYTNLDNLLNYKQSVSSKSIKTCRTIFFQSFRVSSSYSYTLRTDKNVVCTNDCWFGKNTFTCNSVVVKGQGNASNPIGNFLIDCKDNINNSTVYASWYSDISLFFDSKANHLIYDENPSDATRNTLKKNVTLQGCTLEYVCDTHTALKATLTLDGVNLIMNCAYYFGAENTHKIKFKNMHIDTHNFRKLCLSQCDKCVIDVFGEKTDNVDKVLYYDKDGITNNVIRLHEGAFVVNADCKDTWDVVHTLDLNAFSGEIPNDSLWSNIKGHGVVKYKWFRMNNFTNQDFSDVHTLDFDGYDATFNFQAKHDGLIIKNLKTEEGKFVTYSGNANKNIKLTFRDCAMVLKNTTAARFADVEFQDCILMFNESVRFMLGNNVKMYNTKLIDNREPEEEDGTFQYLTTTGTLLARASDIALTYGITADALDIVGCNVSNVANPYTTTTVLYGSKGVNFCNNTCDRHYVLYTGASNHKGNCVICNNNFVQGNIGTSYSNDATNCNVVLVGNVGVAPVIDQERMDLHNCRVADNIGTTKTTDYRYKSIVSQKGVIETGQYGQTMTVVTDNSETTAQSMFTFLQTNYFVPYKTETETYVQWLNRFASSSRHLIGIQEKYVLTTTGSIGDRRSTNGKFLYDKVIETYWKG